jgi:hypothetical protein
LPCGISLNGVSTVITKAPNQKNKLMAPLKIIFCEQPLRRLPA